MDKIYIRLKFELTFVTFLFLMITSGKAQNISRIDPPFWWTEMAQDTLELLIKGERLSDRIELKGEGIHLVSAETNHNQHYLFLKIIIAADAPAQTFGVKIGKKKIGYQLKKRQTKNKKLMGLSPKDVMYLITPDRFANGDKQNDIVQNMADNSLDRNEPYARHGGDLQGIINHLDYIYDLGVTALWLNPVLENNEPQESYHGYAITDHYKIDPRFGDLKTYRNLVDSCHHQNIKMVMDVIYNHFGDQHYLMLDLPDSSWVNFWPSYTRTNYPATTLIDPYASITDQNLLKNGWFDKHMPDINQKNEHVKSYLIQNAIWWIEEFGIDAFRIDTYIYPDQKFMQELTEAILAEYPKFFLFGETWVHGLQVQSYFVGENTARKDFNSQLQSVTDFQLAFAIQNGLKEKAGWTEGINRVYYTLSGDYLYAHPENLVTFLDNHDIARIYGLLDRDIRKFKMAHAILLTTRGIPQLYYGSEILMDATDGHGHIRKDFGGGWSEDTVNKFLSKDRTANENEAHDYIVKLANYRKSSAAITEGKLVQFVPENGVYCYFRFLAEEQIMVLLNASEEKVKVDLSRFGERLENKSTLRDVLSNKSFKIPEGIELAPFESLILEVTE